MNMFKMFETRGRNVVQGNLSKETSAPGCNTPNRAESSQVFEAWLQNYRRQLEQLCQLRTDGLQLDREF